MATTLRIARGEQRNVTMTITDQTTGEPVNLAGAIVTFTAKHSLRDAEDPVIAKSSNDGEISLPDDGDDPPEDPTGQAIVEFLEEDTNAMSDSGMTDELVYQLWAEFPNDDEDETFDGPRHAMTGRLVVTPRVVEVEVV
jgi:hypothetical protein